MLRSMLTYAFAGLLLAGLLRLFAYGRERETDPGGRPVLRYLAAPYAMFVFAAVFFAVAVYQWLDPFNHRHSGNLLLLSYIPAAVGAFALGCAIYYLTYRATLTSDAIEVTRWPFGTTTYRLGDLQRIEEAERDVVAHFSGDRSFRIYAHYSGRAHFIEALSANHGGTIQATD